MALIRIGAGRSRESEALLREVAPLPAPAALARMASRSEGLQSGEVAERLEQSGPNLVASEKPPTWYAGLWHAWNNPFNYILVVLGVLSAVSGNRAALVVVLAMVALSTLLRFVQEFRSSRAALALQAMVRTRATVVRVPDDVAVATAVVRGVDVDIAALVPGDIVQLTAGDMVPADVRILASKDLFVSQSALTGESAPVEKRDAVPADAAALTPVTPLPELPTVAFLGTNIVSGSATAVVVATGPRTMFGGIARSLLGRTPPTAFDIGVNRVSWLLIRFMLVMVPCVVLINGLAKGDWLEAFLFGVAVAVGLTPEMLPMVVTANLAKGAVAMSRQKTIVKRLNAIQNLGAMDVLCTDKTGTLTQDRIVLEHHVNAAGEEDDRVLELAYLNSAFQTGLRSLLDDAVLRFCDRFSHLHGDAGYVRLDEIPFDFSRRRMSVVVRRPGGVATLIAKGAVEELVAASTMFRDGEAIIPLTEATRHVVLDLARAQNNDGLRVVAVAYREFPDGLRAWTAADETDLVFAGYISFLDPPKETAAPAIEALRAQGIAIKILSGDNDLVNRKICRDVGLDPGEVLLGADIAKLDDAQLAEVAERTTVFAKLSPDEKVRVVRALRSREHTVGFLGDGINDAGALREADVGISVDTAVDIARESADIILLEKSLLVLAHGTAEGRRTFANIMKYLKMTASSNFGNVFSVVIASVVLPFLPMLPIQLLAQNLLYDLSQTAIPFDDVDAEYLAVPRRWNADDIGRFMVRIGPLSSIFDLVTFAVLWFAFGADTPARQAFFQSGWFVEGLLTQTLIVHVIRTRKIPFIESRAAMPVLLTTAAIMGVGVILPFTPAGRDLAMTALPVSYFLFVAACLLGYMVVMQLAKGVYARRFGRWL